MNAFRILLADDHPIYRLGLRTVLESYDGWLVCGEADTGPDAEAQCMQLKPDLMIMDICVAGSHIIHVLRHILKVNPAQRILILTEVDSEKVVRDSLQAGICGWILKSDGIENLTTAVKSVQLRAPAIDARTSAVLAGGRWRGNPGQSADQTPPLSRREQEVLHLVAEGKTSKEVALILDIAEKTAATHRANLMAKLDLHSLARLVVYAVRNEVIHIHSALTSEPRACRGNQLVP